MERSTLGLSGDVEALLTGAIGCLRSGLERGHSLGTAARDASTGEGFLSRGSLARSRGSGLGLNLPDGCFFIGGVALLRDLLETGEGVTLSGSGLGSYGLGVQTFQSTRSAQLALDDAVGFGAVLVDSVLNDSTSGIGIAALHELADELSRSRDSGSGDDKRDSPECVLVVT